MDVKEKLLELKKAGASDQELEAVYRDYLTKQKQSPESMIDNKSGAPIHVRALMGNMTPRDQLKTLQRHYPDARPFGDENFVYTDPKTNKLMLANPKGLDWGDVAEYGRVGAQGVSGFLGGLGGMSTGNPYLTYLGIGLGEGIGGQLYDATMKTLGRVDTRSLPEVATQSASDVMLGASSAKAMDKVLPIVTKAGGKMLHGLLSPRKAVNAGKLKGDIVPGASERLDLFEKYGFMPEIGMVADSPTLQTMSQASRKSPGSGPVMDAVDAHNYEAGKSLLDETAALFGRAGTKSQIGSQIKRGAGSAQKQFYDVARHLYDQVDGFIPEDDFIQAPATTKAFADLMEEIDLLDLNKIVYGKLKGIADEFVNAATDPKTGGKVPFKTLKKLKSRFGKSFEKSHAQMTDLDYEYQKLWRAMRDDIGGAAERRGGKDALEKANMWWAAGKGSKKRGQEGYLDTLATIMKQTESGKIYQWMTNEMPYGADKMLRVFQQMPKNVQSNIKATVLYEAGKATPGQQSAFGDAFSFNTFLTNINRMSPEAKTFLFGNAGRASKQFKDLLEISSFMKSLEKNANYSNTAHVSMWKRLTDPLKNAIFYSGMGAGVGGGFEQMIPGALIGGTLAGVSTLGGTYAKRSHAKLMTDPKFLRWLTKTARDAVEKPEIMHKHFAELPIMAQNNPENREELIAYMGALGLPYRVKGGKIEGIKK